MPTVQQVILNLISGLDDATLRMEVARTMMYLFHVYTSGQVDESQIKQSVMEVVRDVIKYLHPELAPEELKRIVGEKTEEIMHAFRMQTMFRRVAVRAGI